jgi:thiamine biosynthesis protein ThiS
VQVIVNGHGTELVEGASVQALLAELGLDGRWVLVERNREPVERRHLSSTTLSDGDRVEIVRAVAGG